MFCVLTAWSNSDEQLVGSTLPADGARLYQRHCRSRHLPCSDPKGFQGGLAALGCS